MIHLDGLAAISAEYDGYIIDLWGVIHDGVRAYPGALDCLGALRAQGKRVVLLSNAPRRAALAGDGLRAFGLDETLYDAIVTSGEATYHALRQRPDPWFERLGTVVYHLGPVRDRSVFEGLGLALAARPEAASFVLNTGPDDERNPTDPAAFDDVLRACRDAGLPMLCANPDLTVVRDGLSIICAGGLAERYEAIGGDVRAIGKPDPAIYEEALAALGARRDRVVVIGDSLRTDIAGAANAGLAAVWILGGIHALAEAQAAQAAAAVGLSPEYAMDRLVWRSR
jgi:HAD superfamily hydrolase (TIGR01459 family)